ncbi:hypothetical protein PENTCL1PPCAC_7307, partial [Pristionchus entomophagus]
RRIQELDKRNMEWLTSFEKEVMKSQKQEKEAREDIIRLMEELEKTKQSLAASERDVAVLEQNQSVRFAVKIEPLEKELAQSSLHLERSKHRQNDLVKSVKSMMDSQNLLEQMDELKQANVMLSTLPLYAVREHLIEAQKRIKELEEQAEFMREQIKRAESGFSPFSFIPSNSGFQFGQTRKGKRMVMEKVILERERSLHTIAMVNFNRWVFLLLLLP